MRYFSVSNEILLKHFILDTVLARFMNDFDKYASVVWTRLKKALNLVSFSYLCNLCGLHLLKQARRLVAKLKRLWHGGIQIEANGDIRQPAAAAAAQRAAGRAALLLSQHHRAHT